MTDVLALELERVHLDERVLLEDIVRAKELEDESRQRGLAAAGVARQDEVPRPVAHPRLEPPESIDLDGATEPSELVLEGVEPDDFGELHLHGIVGGDEGVLDLLHLANGLTQN